VLTLTQYPGAMDDALRGRGLALLAEVREDLLSELGELADKRQALEAQLEAIGKELKKVDVALEAKQRMLGLVEATEQELSHHQEGLHETGPDHLSVEASTEVREGDMAEFSQCLLIPCFPCCNSPRRLSSGPAHLRPLSRRSPSPRGTSLWPCGRTICCRC
jgi:hypothetical protein